MGIIFVTALLIATYMSTVSLLDPAWVQLGYGEKKVRINNTWVSKINDSIPEQGVLYEVTDSSILVAGSFSKESYASGNYTISTIDFNRIDNIKIRPKNAMARGAIIGLVTGIAVGGIAGLISGDDDPGDWFSFTAGQKAFLGGIAVGLTGYATGSFVGLIQLKIPINGKRDTYNRNITRLRKYSLRK
jgi:hypothetical protein